MGFNEQEFKITNKKKKKNNQTPVLAEETINKVKKDIANKASEKKPENSSKKSTVKKTTPEKSTNTKKSTQEERKKAAELWRNTPSPVWNAKVAELDEKKKKQIEREEKAFNTDLEKDFGRIIDLGAGPLTLKAAQTLQSNLRNYKPEERRIFRKYGINPSEFDYNDLSKWAAENNFTTTHNSSGTFYTPKYENGFLGFGGRKLSSDEEDVAFKVLETIANKNTMIKSAKEYPTTMSALTVAAAPVRGVEGAISVGEEVINAVAGKPVSENSKFNKVTQNTNLIRESVDKYHASKWFNGAEGKLGNYGSLIYNGLMSIGDNVMNTLTVGNFVGSTGIAAEKAAKISSKITSALMASDSAASAIIQNKERGLSDARAVGLGVASGLTEYVTEKFSLDRIFKEPTSVMKNILTSFVSEASEEIASNEINRAIDLIVAQGDSEVRTRITAYMASGMSKGAAIKQTLIDCFYEDLSAGIVGGISGAAMSGAYGIVGRQNRGRDIQYSVGSINNGIQNNETEPVYNSMLKYTEDEAQKITKDAKTYRNFVEGKDISLADFFKRSQTGTDKFEKLYLGKISYETAQIINKIFKAEDIDIDVSGENFIVTNNMFSHVEKRHGNSSNESAERVTVDNIEYLKDVINNPDNITFGGFTDEGNPIIVFEKKINGANSIYVQFNSTVRNGLIGKTFYFDRKMDKKKGVISANNTENNPILYVQNDQDQTPFNNISISQGTPDVNTQNQNSTGDTVGSLAAGRQNRGGDIQYSVGNLADNLSTIECQKRFAENVDNVFSGKIKATTNIEIGDTPVILQNYGANPLKIKINQSTMFKIAYPQGYFGAKETGHNLGIPALKQLPKQIANPLALIKSNTEKNSLIILTEWSDTRGKPVIIPLHLDSKGNLKTTDEYVRENKVASMYGKNNIDALLNDENGNSNVLYTKNNENINQLLSDRLQLPVEKSEDTLIKNIIQQKGWNVNDFSITSEKNGKAYINAVDQKTAGKVKNIFGVKIQMHDSIDITDKDGNVVDDANGYYADGVLHISRKAKNPFEIVLTHELTHHMKNADKGAYNHFRLIALNYLSKTTGKTINQLIDEKLEVYKNVGLTRVEAMDEVVADFAGEMMDGGKFFDMLNRLENGELNPEIQKGRGAIARFIEAIKDFCGRIKQQFTSGSVYEQAVSLEEVVKAYERAALGAAQNKGMQFKKNDKNYSLAEINGKKGKYGVGVFLDDNLFEGIKPRYWGRKLSEFVYNNLAGKEITIYDESGQARSIKFAKTNERVLKDGANNSHKVIDKLARTKGNIQTLSIVHIDELLQTSVKMNENQENVHQWLDRNGWEYRRTYVQDIKGRIYEATLNIARAADGRDILYSISNVKEVDAGVVPSNHKKRGSHISSTSAYSISQKESDVKREDVPISKTAFEDYGQEAKADKSDTSQLMSDLIERYGEIEPGEKPKRIAQDFGMGTAIGGILGGAQVGTALAGQAMANRIQNRESSPQYSVGKSDIGLNMADEARAEALKNKTVGVVDYQDTIQKRKEQNPGYTDYYSEEDKNVINNRKISEVKKTIRDVLESRGVFKNTHFNTDTEIKVVFSKRNLNESVQNQNEVTGEYQDFAKLTEIFGEVFEKSVLIQQSSDKYYGTKRENPVLDKMCVFMGVFSYNGRLVPCEFEVKLFTEKTDTPNTLYMTVTLGENKTRATSKDAGSLNNQQAPHPILLSDITIPQLLENVNILNGNIYRHIPDGLLTEEQIEAKRNSQIRDNEKIYGYAMGDEWVMRAGELVEGQAKLKGYTKGEDGYFYDESGNRKLSDAFTYDDEGNIIPLSERLDRNNPDPRYSVGGNSKTYVNTVDQKTAGKVKNIFGVKIQMHDSIDITDKNGNVVDDANGYYEDGVLHISRKAKNPFQIVLTHELTHHMKNADKGAYNHFRLIALNYLSKTTGKSINQLIDEKMEVYKNVDLTRVKAMDEVVADFAGEMMDGGKFFDMLNRLESGELNPEIQKGRGAIARFIEAIKDFCGRIKQQFTSGSVYEKAVSLEEVVKAYERAAFGAARNKGKVSRSGKIMFDLKSDDSIAKTFNITKINDFIHVQKNVIRTLKNEGFFSDIDGTSKIVTNKESGMVIEITPKGIKETFGEKNYIPISKILKNAKLYTVRMLPQLIENGRIISDNVSNIHKENSGLRYAYIETDTMIGDEVAKVKIAIRKSPQKNRFWVHQIDIIKGDENTPAGAISSKTGYQFSITKDSISQKESDVKREDVPISKTAFEDYGQEAKADKSDTSQVMSDLIERYGEIEPGEKPKRNVHLPKRISDKKYVSRYARTMAEAGITSDDTASEIERMVADGTLTHEVITNKSALSYAESTIKDLGFEDAIKYWDYLARDGKIGKREFALGQTLYNQAVTQGDAKTAMKLISDLVTEGTYAGQSLQAARLLKLMSPDGKLYYIEKSIQKMNREFKESLGNRYKDIELDESLVESFLKAENEEQRNAVYDSICENIAKQIPATKLDKWNSWRYLAMLGNPRTHMRNIIGNAVFVPAVRIKNFIGAGLEKAARIDPEKRTKGIRKSRDAVAFAKKDFEDMVGVLQGENAKYAITGDIESKRRIFKTKWLEALRKKNFDFLEAEDLWFLKSHYVDTLARIITVRKLDPNKLSEAALANMREYAVKQAQAATYRDANALADAISRLQKNTKNSDSKMARGMSLLIEGVMPFKKTPMNIVKQGINYSPVSILKGIYKAGKKLKTGEGSATEVIEDLAMGLTGSSVMLLGAFLGSLGMLGGGADEDKKKKEFDKMVGEQSYSLNINGNSYTIDWATPLCLPLFIGGELYELVKSDGLGFWDMINSIKTLTEPLLELSVFSGVSDVIDAAKYSETNSGLAVASEMASSYLLQAFPTMGGQLSRIIDSTKRNYYYVDKNSDVPKELQTLKGQMASKVPFASYLFEPSVDAWGRDETYGGLLARGLENTISPGYHSQENYTEVDEEIQEIYALTGDNSVFPVIQAKYFTEDGVTYHMNAKDYTEAKRLRGQRSFELVSELIKSKKYEKMDNSEKAEAISECYKTAGKEVKELMLEQVMKKNKNFDENAVAAKEPKSDYEQYAEERSERKKADDGKYITYKNVKYQVSEEFYEEFGEYKESYKEELWNRIFKKGENIEKVIGKKYSVVNGKRVYFTGNINKYSQELQDKLYDKLSYIADDAAKEKFAGTIKKGGQVSSDKVYSSKSGSGGGTKKASSPVQTYNYTNKNPFPVKQESDGSNSVRIVKKYYSRSEINPKEIGTKYKRIAASPTENSELSYDGWRSVMNAWLKCLTERKWADADRKTLQMDGRGVNYLSLFVNDPESVAAAFFEWVEYGEEKGYDTSEYLELKQEE